MEHINKPLRKVRFGGSVYKIYNENKIRGSKSYKKKLRKERTKQRLIEQGKWKKLEI